MNIADEKFTTKGNKILHKNFLEVYPDWPLKETELPELEIGAKVPVSGLKLEESSTKPPPLLSESALIGLMDKNGIGTDATIHEHINKIQERGYAFKEFNLFKPTPIGTCLSVI